MNMTPIPDDFSDHLTIPNAEQRFDEVRHGERGYPAGSLIFEKRIPRNDLPVWSSNH